MILAYPCEQLPSSVRSFLFNIHWGPFKGSLAMSIIWHDRLLLFRKYAAYLFDVGLQCLLNNLCMLVLGSILCVLVEIYHFVLIQPLLMAMFTSLFEEWELCI